MKVGVLVGHPKPASPTRDVAMALTDALLIGVPVDLHVVELADHASSFATLETGDEHEVTGLMADCELLIVASPAHGGAHSGLLQTFLDLYPRDGLIGVTAIPILTGPETLRSTHAGGVLAGALLERGAAVLGRDHHFTTGGDSAAQAHAVEAAVAEYAGNIARIASIASGMRRMTIA